MKRKKYFLVGFGIILFSINLFGQVVDNELGNRFKEIFPELEEGYIDLNANGKRDEGVDLSETIPDSRVKDSIIQVQEILDFLAENFRYIPLNKLQSVKNALTEVSGVIPEVISFSYRNLIGTLIEEKIKLGEDGIFFTPTALQEARQRMGELISLLVSAYKKEAREYETDFIKARDELLEMIERGFPLPGNLNNEELDVLKSSLIYTVVKEKDSNPQRVGAAVKALGALKAGEAVPYLTELMEVEEYKLDSIKALGEIGTRSALNLLTEQLAKTTGREATIVIIEAMGKIGGEESLNRLLKFFPQSDGENIEPEIEKAALEALKTMAEKNNNSPQIYNILKNYLEFENPEYRILAIRGLSNFRSTSSAELLFSLLNREKNEDVKTMIIRSLNELNHSSTIPAFIGLLRDENTSDIIREEVLKALAKNPQGIKAVQYIREELGSSSEKVRKASAQALVELYKVDSRAVVGALLRGLTTSNQEEFLTQATEVLARIADRDSSATLVNLLDKPFPEVKKNVTWALYRIRPEPNIKTVDVLNNLVTSETEPLEVRINAVRALGVIGYDSPRLRVWQTMVTTAKMRGEKYAMLRYFAIQTLGLLGESNQEILNTLTSIVLREKDPELKKEAVMSIRRLAVVDSETEKVLSDFFRTVEDQELKVRIIETLGDMGSAELNKLAVGMQGEEIGLSVRRRVIYALSKAGGEDNLSAVIDFAVDPELREFILGVLEDADTGIMRPLVNRRLKTESDQEVLYLLKELDSIYAAHF